MSPVYCEAVTHVLCADQKLDAIKLVCSWCITKEKRREKIIVFELETHRRKRATQKASCRVYSLLFE